MVFTQGRNIGPSLAASPNPEQRGGMSQLKDFEIPREISNHPRPASGLPSASIVCLDDGGDSEATPPDHQSG
jgi:hypothetical protein